MLEELVQIFDMYWRNKLRIEIYFLNLLKELKQIDAVEWKFFAYKQLVGKLVRGKRILIVYSKN